MTHPRACFQKCHSLLFERVLFTFRLHLGLRELFMQKSIRGAWTEHQKNAGGKGIWTKPCAGEEEHFIELMVNFDAKKRQRKTVVEEVEEVKEKDVGPQLEGGSEEQELIVVGEEGEALPRTEVPFGDEELRTPGEEDEKMVEEKAGWAPA